jgi:hypothetical protein
MLSTAGGCRECKRRHATYSEIARQSSCGPTEKAAPLGKKNWRCVMAREVTFCVEQCSGIGGKIGDSSRIFLGPDRERFA